MIRFEFRRAATAHQCGSCSTFIKQGERYRFSVASPDHDDLGNSTWWPMKECRECCLRYDRWEEPSNA